jgi:UDP-2,3-diacylglucosamine hydrolase
MKRIRFVLAVLLSAMGFAQALALDLDTARDLALANSRSLVKYQLATENALWDERIQGYAVLPSLSLGLSASANLWGATGFLDSLGAGLNFGVSQKLYDGGKQGLLTAINRIATEITRQEALGAYFAVLDEVDAAYYGVLEAEAALESAVSAREAAVLALDIAEIRLASGMISYGDYLQALAEKESKETSWNQARRDLTLNKGKLKNLTALAEIPPLEGADFAGQEELIQRLAELSDAGVRIYFFAGNHDVWVKDYLRQECGIEVFHGTQTFTLGNKTFFVGHGNNLGKRTVGERILIWIFYNRILQRLYSMLHPRWGIGFGHLWSQHTRSAKGIATLWRGAAENLYDFAAQQSAETKIDYFVFGHRHTPVKMALPCGTQLFVLSDWIVGSTYAVYDGTALALKEFA